MQDSLNLLEILYRFTFFHTSVLTFLSLFNLLHVQVLEVRPVINWDKGKAVTFLLESLGKYFSPKNFHDVLNLSYEHTNFSFFSGLSDCDDVLPIYVGDDRTDEDAFKVKSQIYYELRIQISCFRIFA